ncbi:hypothetical protein GIY23_21260 [Allosaccharopolyspora coralli]|uniref:Uncharacterized protein n=1 Tax=Allosaccharopolyspora coralli TaxID=2665642 RepID=A0A5Q3QLK9_9PSEU|nr:hypothetical protein [Allosaccharopolyspora coralli]QGK71707.1 hypothetical protein GIY23_21260 [Allosaccharopolyspora coralli]
MALGRKIGRRQRPESAATEQAPAQPDHELDSYLAALTPEGDVETTGTGRQFGSSQVHQVRLPLMANEKLNALAARKGTSPAALVRDWVMHHLEAHPDPEPQGGPQWPQEQPEPAQHFGAARDADHDSAQHFGGQFPGADGRAGDPHAQAFPGPQAGKHSPQPFGQQDPQFPADPYAGAGEETDNEITMPRGQGYYA